MYFVRLYMMFFSPIFQLLLSDNVNECATYPCEHEGSCMDEEGSFTCHCVPGWMGRQCQCKLVRAESFITSWGKVGGFSQNGNFFSDSPTN